MLYLPRPLPNQLHPGGAASSELSRVVWLDHPPEGVGPLFGSPAMPNRLYGRIRASIMNALEHWFAQTWVLNFVPGWWLSYMDVSCQDTCNGHTRYGWWDRWHCQMEELAPVFLVDFYVLEFLAICQIRSLMSPVVPEPQGLVNHSSPDWFWPFRPRFLMANEVL